MKFLVQRDRLVIRLTRQELEEFTRIGEYVCDYSRGGIIPFQVFLLAYPGEHLSWENLPGAFRLLVPRQLLDEWTIHPERLGLVRNLTDAHGQPHLLILELDLHDGKSSSQKKLNEHTHLFLT